jgi:hypothetical protein
MEHTDGPGSYDDGNASERGIDELAVAIDAATQRLTKCCVFQVDVLGHLH